MHTSQYFGRVWFGNIAGENSEGDASYVEKGSTSAITKGAGPQPHPHDTVVVYAEVNRSKEQRKVKTDVGPRATTTLGVQPEEPHYEFGRGYRNLARIKPERNHGDMKKGAPMHIMMKEKQAICQSRAIEMQLIHWWTKV